MKSSIALRKGNRSRSSKIKAAKDRKLKSQMAHLVTFVLVLSSSTFSFKLAIVMVAAWIGYSLYTYVLLPIARIDVDFRRRDDIREGLERELWP